MPTNFFGSRFNDNNRLLTIDQIRTDIGGENKIMRFPRWIGVTDYGRTRVRDNSSGPAPKPVSSIPFVVFAPYKRQVGSSGSLYNTNPAKILEELPPPKFAIILPLPSSGLKTDYTVSYDTPSFAGSAGVIATGVDQGFKNYAEDKKLTEEQLKNIGKRILEAEAGLATIGGLEGLLKGTGSAAQIATGVGINPFTEIMFKEVPFRVHSFNYTLIPRNREESQMIDEMVQYFKFYMLPSFSLAGTAVAGGINNELSTYLSFPYEWQIIQSVQDTTFRLLPSVLQKFNVDYSGGLDSPKFFLEPGSDKRYPTKITMQLEFREVIQLTRDRIATDDKIKDAREEDQTSTPFTRYRF